LKHAFYSLQTNFCLRRRKKTFSDRARGTFPFSTCPLVSVLMVIDKKFCGLSFIFDMEFTSLKL
jgi:hypothetical protein